jgi:hypothetical protein
MKKYPEYGDTLRRIVNWNVINIQHEKNNFDLSW